jgi:ferredoxin-like protein FixX
MARYGMVFDLKRCIGCNACVIGCKQENSLPDGVFFTRTLSEEYGVYPAVNRVYIPTLCNHCEDAPCEKVCPSGATYTRPDGIVMVDPQKCIGCGSCAVACPYDQRSEMKAEAFKDGLFGTGELTDFEKAGLSPLHAGHGHQVRFLQRPRGCRSRSGLCRDLSDGCAHLWRPRRPEQQAEQADTRTWRQVAAAREKYPAQGVLHRLRTGAEGKQHGCK